LPALRASRTDWSHLSRPSSHVQSFRPSLTITSRRHATLELHQHLALQRLALLLLGPVLDGKHRLDRGRDRRDGRNHGRHRTGPRVAGVRGGLALKLDAPLAPRDLGQLRERGVDLVLCTLHDKTHAWPPVSM